MLLLFYYQDNEQRSSKTEAKQRKEGIMSMITDLKQYRERLDEEVRPVMRMVENYLTNREGGQLQDLDAAQCLGNALKKWEAIDSGCEN